MSTDETTKGVESLRDSGKVSQEVARAAINQPLEAEKLLRMDRIEESQGQSNTMLREIHTALVGNDYGTTGIVKRLATVEQKLLEFDRKSVFWAGIVAAASALCSGLAAWWAGHK